MWLVHSAVSTGYDDGTFRGMTDVYRQDMAAFLHRVFDLDEAKYDDPNSDHVHDWSIGVGSNSRGGIACNGCARDVTDWDDPMSCCGGWHTHTWITDPGGSMCSMCGLKRHLHTWRYVEPAYYSGTDEIMRPGYWGVAAVLKARTVRLPCLSRSLTTGSNAALLTNGRPHTISMQMERGNGSFWIRIGKSLPTMFKSRA